MSKPDKAPQSQRLLAAHGQPCPYCTRTMNRGHVKLMPTSDHIVAKSKLKGVSKSTQRRKGRTIIVCSECNFMKSTHTFEEFITVLQEKNEGLLQAVFTNISRMRNIRYLLDIGLEE